MKRIAAILAFLLPAVTFAQYVPIKFGVVYQATAPVSSCVVGQAPAVFVTSSGCTWYCSGAAYVEKCPPGGAAGYTTVQEDGGPLPDGLPKRSTINFTGPGMFCSDIGSVTVCNVPGAPGGGDNVSINTTAVTDPDFRSIGGDIDFVLAGPVVTANIKSAIIVNGDIAATDSITDDKLAPITTGGSVANSATTAVSTSTPNTIVLRDGSNNFAAGTISGNLTGNVTGNVTGNASGTALSVTGSFGGDVTGTQSAIAVTDDSHGHSATTLTGVYKQVQKTGVTIVPNATVLNFTGLGITCSNVGGVPTCDVPAAPGGGDNVSVNSGAVVDPNFTSTGDIDFTNIANVITANIESLVITDGDISNTANIAASKLDPQLITASELAASNALGFTGSLAGDVTGTQGATTVGDNSHNHDGTTITDGSIDISTDTNLSVTASQGLTLTGDALAVQACTGDQILKRNAAGTQWICAADGGPVGSGITAVSGDTGTPTDATTITIRGNTLGIDTVSSNTTDDIIVSLDPSEITLTGDLNTSTLSNPQVVDNSHNHDTTTISGLDISADTNLTAGDGITLTGDALTMTDCAANEHLVRNAGDTAWVCAATGGGTLTGSGATNQLAIWSSPTGLTGDTGLTYDTSINEVTADVFKARQTASGGSITLTEGSPGTDDVTYQAPTNLVQTNDTSVGAYNVATNTCTLQADGRIPDACVGDGSDTGGTLPTGTQYGVAYYGTTSTIASTTAGTSGQILKSNATSAPTWTDSMAVTITSEAPGDLVYRNATGWVNSPSVNVKQINAVVYANNCATGLGTLASPWPGSCISAAWASLPAGVSGTVKMMPGVYDLGSGSIGLNLDNGAVWTTGFTLEGAGGGNEGTQLGGPANDGGTILLYSGTGEAIRIGSFSTAGGNTWLENSKLRGFKVRQTGTAGTSIGILARLFRWGTIEDVTVTDFATGIALASVSDFNHLNHVRLRDNRAYGLDLGRTTNAAGGALGGTGGQCNGNRLTHCDIANSVSGMGFTNWGVWIHSNAVQTVIENSEFHNFDTVGVYGAIRIDDGSIHSNVQSVRGCYIEYNRIGVYHNNPFAAQDQGTVAVRDNYFSNILSYGVWINSGGAGGVTDGAIVEGNRFDIPTASAPHNAAVGVQLGSFVQNARVGPNSYSIAGVLGTLPGGNVVHAVLGAITQNNFTLGTARTTGAVKFDTSINYPSGTFAAKPAAPATGDTYLVTDALTSGDCTAGAGTGRTICRYNGSVWQSVGDGGGAEVNNLELNNPPTILDNEVYVGTGAGAGTFTPLQTCTTGTQSLRWDGTAFVCDTISGGSGPTAGTGIAVSGSTVSLKYTETLAGETMANAGECEFSSVICSGQGGIICESTSGTGAVELCAPGVAAADRSVFFPPLTGTGATPNTYVIAESANAFSNTNTFAGATTFNTTAPTFNAGAVFNTTAPTFNTAPTFSTGVTMGNPSTIAVAPATNSTDGTRMIVTPPSNYPGVTVAAAFVGATNYAIPISVSSDSGKQYKLTIDPGGNCGSTAPTGTGTCSVAATPCMAANGTNALFECPLGQTCNNAKSDGVCTWQYIGRTKTGAARGYSVLGWSPSGGGGQNYDGIGGTDSELQTVVGYNYNGIARPDPNDYAFFQQWTWGFTSADSSTIVSEWFTTHETIGGIQWHPWTMNVTGLQTEKPYLEGLTIQKRPGETAFQINQTGAAFGGGSTGNNELEIYGGNGTILLNGDNNDEGYIRFDGTTEGGASTWLSATDATTDRFIKLPNASGTLALAVTENITFNFLNVAATDINPVHIPSGGTITRIACFTDVGSVATVNINKRAQATPLTSGTNVTTTAYTCNTAGVNTAQTINSAGITAGDWLYPTLGTVTSAPKVLTISVDYTVP